MAHDDDDDDDPDDNVSYRELKGYTVIPYNDRRQ